MSNGRTIVTGALRGLGRIGRGMSMTGDQGTDGLEILNQLIASWAGEGLMIPYRTKEALSYSAVQNEYTIGTGGDLNTERPVQVLDGYHRDANGIDYRMELMSFRRYGDIAEKDIENYPTRLYYEPEYPLGKIHFDYKPQSGLTLHLTSLKHITSLADLDTDISLPPEYDRALKFNLMLDIAPDYGMTVSNEIVNAATESKRNIKRLAKANRESIITVDHGLVGGGGSYNIFNDGYY